MEKVHESVAESKEAKKIILAKAKVSQTVWLQFTGLEDIKELVRFTGVTPRINKDLVLRIKSFDLITPCLINVDHVGNIKEVLTLDEFNKRFDIIEEKVYTESFSAKPQEEKK